MAEFLKRFFKKDKPEEISYGDFLAFIKQGVEEHQNLEYKPRGLLVRQDDTIISSSNQRELVGFSALAKFVASFANSEGGLLILGVKEKPEKHKGVIVKVRPGAISPLPANVAREMIENNLSAKIQYPIDELTILPLRSSPKSSKFVYLIDIPQSFRAPHRVNELYYFQRYNFSTFEMKHYQIADLFGKRLTPNLEIGYERKKGLNEDRGHFTIEPIIFNRGRAAAKYTTCICEIVEGPYRIMQGQWDRCDNEKSCRFSTGVDAVVYPDIPTNTGYIEFAPLGVTREEQLILRFGLYAEGMVGKSITLSINPRTLA